MYYHYFFSHKLVWHYLGLSNNVKTQSEDIRRQREDFKIKLLLILRIPDFEYNNIKDWREILKKWSEVL